MENLSAVAIHAFRTRGGCYGLLLRIRGQAFIFGGTERGIFYRFGVKINEYKPGKWEALFGLRTRVGIGELMIKKWMKNEVVPLKFRPGGIRGALHFSRTGVISFVGGSKHIKDDNKIAQQLLPDNYQTEQRGGIDSY